MCHFNISLVSNLKKKKFFFSMWQCGHDLRNKMIKRNFSVFFNFIILLL